MLRVQALLLAAAVGLPSPPAAAAEPATALYYFVPDLDPNRYVMHHYAPTSSAPLEVTLAEDWVNGCTHCG